MRIPDNVPDAVLFAAAAARKATLRETRGKYATIKSQVQCPYCAFGPLGVTELRRHKRTCKANPRTLHPRGPGTKFAPWFASKEDVHTFLKQSGWSKGGMSVIPGLGSGVQKGQQWNHPVHGKLWVGGEKFYHQPHDMAGTPVSNKIFWKQTTDPKKQPVDIQKMFPSGKPPAAAPVDLNKLAEKVQSNEGAPPKPPAINSALVVEGNVAGQAWFAHPIVKGARSGVISMRYVGEGVEEPKKNGPPSVPPAQKVPDGKTPARGPGSGRRKTLADVLPAGKPRKEAEAMPIHPTWERPKSWKQQAYGGVAVNTQGQFLIREPAGHFDGYHFTWPKGKMNDKNEHPVDVATREVQEETGWKVRVIDAIPGTYKSGSGSHTNMFMMRAAGMVQKPADDDQFGFVERTGIAALGEIVGEDILGGREGFAGEFAVGAEDLPGNSQAGISV